jgi:hypothetical protein
MPIHLKRRLLFCGVIALAAVMLAVAIGATTVSSPSSLKTHIRGVTFTIKAHKTISNSVECDHGAPTGGGWSGDIVALDSAPLDDKTSWGVRLANRSGHSVRARVYVVCLGAQ